MTFKKRFLIVVLIICAALGMAGILATLQSGPTVGAAPDIITTSEPPFWATVSIVPDGDTVRVGETLTLTVDIEVSPGCQYPIFEMTLRQDETEPPLFAHIAPPSDIITGPLAVPAVWTFQATQPGTATFDARTFGEKHCGFAWIWHYETAESGPITVLPPETFVNWLPLVTRPTNNEE